MPLPRLLGGRRSRLLLCLIANGVAQAGATVATAFLIKLAFDRLLGVEQTGDEVQPFLLLFSVAGGLALAAILIAWLRMREITDGESLAQDYIYRLRVALFARLASLSPRAMQKRSRGSVMLRFVGDLSAVRLWVALGLARLIVAGIASVGVLAALAVLNWVLALSAFAVLGTGALATFALGTRLQDAVRETRRRTSHVAANVNEKVASMTVVQLFNRSEHETQRANRQNRRLREATLARARLRGLMRALTEGATALATATVFVLGALEVMGGAATAGTVVAAMTIVGLLVPQMRNLGRVYEYYQGNQVAHQKIVEFLDTPTLINELQNAPDLKPGPGRVEFIDVSVGNSLCDFSAQAPAGSVVAIVGPNGAGKSTLLTLLARLIDPDRGKILLDGQDLSLHSLKSLRRQVSMVGPDLNLLRGTVDSNLRYRRPDAPPEEIARVCELCAIAEMAEQLPDGLETKLTEGGGNLSPGQRNRIALARALIGKPSILLLDEAEANLDPRASQVLDRILEEFPGTVMLVTHRRERLAAADLIWHLNEGRLVETGNARALLDGEGPTANFFGSKQEAAAVPLRLIG